jgi:hypothetical protein
MSDLDSLNYMGPSIDTTKHKGLRFIPGEHADVFKVVANIYWDAMQAHSIIRPVPVILVEDETKVKSRVSWEAKFDTLASFCGSKDSHVCVTNYKPVVGLGEAGYNKVVNAFQYDKVGGYARVVMVNPLHEKLP